MVELNGFNIDPFIESASTLPVDFYRNKEIFEILKEKVFERSWQFITEEDQVKLPGDVFPFSFLPGYVDEPLILTRDKDDNIQCMSNVCTHRGNLLVKNACNIKTILCSYHGRRFDLNGKFKSMPECDGMKNFPAASDDLPALKIGQLGPLLFTSINPAFDFSEITADIYRYVGFLPLNEFIFNPHRSQDYLVKANWALYCDNYLEGFHIPFVHPDLNAALDYSNYRTDIFKYSNLQVGVASGGDNVFDLPSEHPDYGKKIAAYYFWVFPNIMLNFYPWGLSMNIVKPIDTELTKVSYRTYILDASKINNGAGGALDKVEREDQNIVENVQAGIRSKLYQRGRFSPKMEKGVHHFHSLIAQFIKS
jgi:choline monooxygenase